MVLECASASMVYPRTSIAVAEAAPPKQTMSMTLRFNLRVSVSYIRNGSKDSWHGHGKKHENNNNNNNKAQALATPNFLKMNVTRKSWTYIAHCSL
ncbi:hypothetical protein TIFTF001_002793 [Ficus carica]|uniref:Uncharacterized protein n=1 Tax=Ficus carica TaxID=3494 RepID=A0AA87ZPG4_FICCA|nr:hypothetical protein TIFTF001_002793 [Ficus carica]